MSKKLLIVESPAKAGTINKYLGSDFVVAATYGHVRDLPEKKLGVDVEGDFAPEYVVPPRSKKNVSNIKRLAVGADEIYLATDLDREGESISWHIAEAAKLKGAKRITFDEISKEAILEALKNPREVNIDLVDAQQARRVIDRLVGYKLSPLLWRKVMKGLSAGRVQSVAVRLVVEREREIEKFKPEEYWQIVAILEKDKINFEARLTEENGKKIDKLDIKTEKQAREIEEELKGGKYIVRSVESKEERRNPSAPYTTSTLQQDAGNQFGFSAKQTMRLAQGLYEAGYITYMRTDSVNISVAAQTAIVSHIKKEFGMDYVADGGRKFQTKTKRAQEAHEAVRPVKVEAKEVSTDGREQKLYNLIWRRAVASQMKEAILDVIEAKIKNNEYIFLARGQSVKFDGFLKLYPERVKAIEIPQLEKEDILKLIELKNEQKFTEPPARYSEATLIKALEEYGIGRPSTYAPTLSTIQDRGYVIKESGRLKPEKVGMVVNDLLVKNFADVVDYGFTAQIEDELDEIAEGKRKWQTAVKDFYVPFEKNLSEKSESIEKTSLHEEMDEKCPDCGKQLILRHSRRGKFIGCSGFPECRYTRNFVEPKMQEKIDQGQKSIDGKKCPKCGSDLKIASGKYGPFIGCTKYPECKYIEKIG